MITKWDRKKKKKKRERKKRFNHTHCNTYWSAPDNIHNKRLTAVKLVEMLKRLIKAFTCTKEDDEEEEAFTCTQKRCCALVFPVLICAEKISIPFFFLSLSFFLFYPYPYALETGQANHFVWNLSLTKWKMRKKLQNNFCKLHPWPKSEYLKRQLVS